MTTEHAPDPAFLQQLEWQTRTALRREARFAVAAAPPRLRWARTAALVLVSLLGGAATVVAAERVQASRQRELLLARSEVQRHVALVRHDVALGELTRIQQQHDMGMVDLQAVHAAELVAQRADRALRRLRLDAEEIDRAGREPSDALAAPLIGGRDFVTERLDAAAAGQRAELDVLDRSLARALAAYEAGLVTQRDVDEARLPREDLASRLHATDGLRALRRDFLAGLVSPEEVELRATRVDGEARLAAATAAVEQLGSIVELMRRRAEAGVVNRSELQRAELRLDEAAAEVRIVELELELTRAERDR